MKGMIKKVIRKKGFGFISAEDGNDIFSHRSALQGIDFGNLAEDTSVEFDSEKGPKGKSHQEKE